MTSAIRVENETNDVEDGPLGANQRRQILDSEHRSPTRPAVRKKPRPRVAALALAGAPLLAVFGCGSNPARVLPAVAPSVSVAPVQNVDTPATCNQLRCPSDHPADPSQTITVGPLAAAGAEPR